MTSSQFININAWCLFSTGNWNSAGGRMTKCKIDVHLYPDNSGRNTGWEY